MNVDHIRLKFPDELQEAPGGEKGKAAGPAGEAGQQGVEPSLPVQTELIDMLPLHLVSPAVANGGGVAVRPALGIQVVYDLSGAALFADNVDV